ncbi:Pullulanase 1, chloroplastic-like protein [Drosera capensis]
MTVPHISAFRDDTLFDGLIGNGLEKKCFRRKTLVLEKLPLDSRDQQAQITAIQNEDAYNWGYDPVLWGVPKGSYALTLMVLVIQLSSERCAGGVGSVL